jgi:hypothetical protein
MADDEYFEWWQAVLSDTDKDDHHYQSHFIASLYFLWIYAWEIGAND